MSSNSGKLWIVATPLGNPGDFSPRARDAVANADMVLAEDTRRSGILLKACGITAKRFTSLHDHNEAARIPSLVKELQDGAVAALVSDAGTPAISDPGFLLVRACREAGIDVSPIPGPSAPVAALAASGFPPLPFVFLGFAPRGEGDIRKWFTPFASLPATLIFFERKDRLTSTLALAREILGSRAVCIARELTKTYEEFIYFDLADPMPERELLGELTILLAPPRERRCSEQDVLSRIRACKEECPAGKPKDIARLVHEIVSGWNVKDIYALMQKQASP